MPAISQIFYGYAILLPILIGFLPTLVDSAPLEKRLVPDKAGWKKTWWEDFTHKDGIRHNWINDTGTSYPGQVAHWGTGEVETYTNRKENIQVNNGILSIIPRKSRNSNGVTSWTSARIETIRSDFQCLNGKKMLVEGLISLGSAKVEQQKGIWPAFWTLGQKFRTNGNKGWPEPGEWDIMESVNGMRTAWGITHCGIYDGQKGIKGPCQEPNGLGGATNGISRGAWHRFGFEVDRTSKYWRTEKLTWYIDGKAQRVVTGAQVNNQTAWDFLAHKPVFILLNVAVGGSFPNAIEGKTTPTTATIDGSSVAMNVDWVAVYNSI